MRILLCHNSYQQRGGEDQVFEDERWLLEANGHEVVVHTRSNNELNGRGKLQMATETVWNRRTHAELSALVERERPDVVHFTNTFPILSPAAYSAARSHGAAVVQTLHNYRLLCPNAQFLRNGKVCESCLGKTFPWPAVQHGCYRESRAATGVVATMLAVHRLRGTYESDVDEFVALTDFAREKFVAAGLPADRISVKPNFVHPEPETGPGGEDVVFVGRLSKEKGLDTLLEAWRRVETDRHLVIVGDGPERPAVEKVARLDSRVEYLGRRPFDEVLRIVGKSACLVMPSIWYETFGRTIVEAFAIGTPVVASRLGAMAELVDDGRTGRLFEPGDPADLARRLRELLHDTDALRAMRPVVRAEFESRYTAESNYPQLLAAYERAIAHRGTSSPAPVGAPA